MEKAGQWERIKELFDAALQRPQQDRASFLTQACGPDHSLRAEIESLLSAHARADGLSTPVYADSALPGPQPLASIGPYRLIRKIGEGGMGQVWLAGQLEPIRRQVALKLIRSGVFDEALLRRFQAERQSLALMDHPAIAKVFDAGATPNGQPYFVMEYVAGEPITAYCDRVMLSIPERLELFIKVCEGVQHAHQKAMIHRDLKPANILVVEIDGKPAPRLIDFGLAKAVAELPATGDSMFASAWSIAGTPGYISPEQAAGGDVDTRTDVYSLGVVLYQILTGSLPFASENWRKRPFDEVLRELREQDPPRPSTRLATDRQLANSSARLRATEPKHLKSLLHGDLDSIAMKALEKDRARRYGTASELAADIARFLDHEPVLARPAGVGYRARKYARRHRVAVGIAAALVVLLASFAVVEAVQLRRITRERDRANRVTDFMTGMFRVSDPGEARGNQVTAREILDKASSQIDSGLAKDPELQAQMMSTMGFVYNNLGLFDRSESLYRQAVQIRLRLFGPENDATLIAQTHLAWELAHLDREREAEALLRHVIEIRIRRFGMKNRDTLGTMSFLSIVLGEEGHYAEAESLARQVLDQRRRLLGDSNPDTLATMNHLSQALKQEGKWAEAEKLEREQLDAWRRSSGNDSPDSMREAENLGYVLDHEGRYAESETLLRQTLSIERRVLGPDHLSTLWSMSNLAEVLSNEGKLEEAQALEEQVLAAQTRLLGPDDSQTLYSMSDLAEILTRRGDYAHAEKLLVQAHDIDVKKLGPDNAATALSTYDLACLAVHRGKPDDALRLLRDAVDHGLIPSMVKDMSSDPDLKPLHGDPRFTALLAYAAGQASASTK